MISLQLTTIVGLLAAVANAQSPRFLGELVVHPGRDTTKCLTAASNTDGAQVTIDTCTGAAAQKWTFGDAQRVKIFGDKCLNVVDGNTADGTKLQIWTCSTNGDVNEKFWFSYWDNTLSWQDHGKCLDLTDGSTSNGNRPQLWTCYGNAANQVWNVGYQYDQIPNTVQDGQYGNNACGTENSQSSNCQTAWINSAEDFCLWAPPEEGAIGDTEHMEVAWCTKTGRGSRTIPNGALQGVHFVKTPDYVQVTGVGDFTGMNIPDGDQGGELDPHGADGNGNPVGGLVYGSGFGANLQYHEWTSFISYSEFCFRACYGDNARENCQHIYDVMGCYWNMPANYDSGVFENCDADSAEPMGVYGTSTWYQGVEPTPSAHPQPSSSNCQALPTVSSSPLRRKRSTGFEKVKRELDF